MQVCGGLSEAGRSVGEPGTALMLQSLGLVESQSCRKQVKVPTHEAGARPELDWPKVDVPDGPDSEREQT